MRVLLVVDPIRDEFIGELAHAAAGGLTTGGHDVDIVDLVAERFSPVMTDADRRAYFSDAPLVSTSTAAGADLVRGADALVLVYPSTLSTVTPGVKGWIERTLVPGVAFTIGDRTAAKRAMSNIRHLVGIAVYDDSRWGIVRHGDNGRRLIQRNLRMCCGVRTRSSWLGMYSRAQSTTARRGAFLARVERAMARL